jgi:hypothetical protein
VLGLASGFRQQSTGLDRSHVKVPLACNAGELRRLRW